MSFRMPCKEVSSRNLSRGVVLGPPGDLGVLGAPGTLARQRERACWSSGKLSPASELQKVCDLRLRDAQGCPRPRS